MGLGPGRSGRKKNPADPAQAAPEVPPAELHLEVPENYGGNLPLYLAKVSTLSPASYTLCPFWLWLAGRSCLVRSVSQSVCDWQELSPRLYWVSGKSLDGNVPGF